MRAKHFLQLGGLSALWGASFMLTRIAVPSLGPYLLATLRMSLATVVLAIIMRALKQPWPFQHWREIFMLGAISVAGPHVLYAWSAQGLPAGYGALLSVTAVLFGAVASAWFGEEVFSYGKMLGCILGLCGAALVVQLGPINPTNSFVISALVCTAASALSGISASVLKRATQRMEPLAITAGMHGAGVLLMSPGAISDWPKATFTWPAIGAIAVMGIATSGIAYWMYMRILRHVTPLAALSSTFMTTGFGVIWAYLVLNEQFGAAFYLGGALIHLACLLVAGINPLKRIQLRSAN